MKSWWYKNIFILISIFSAFLSSTRSILSEWSCLVFYLNNNQDNIGLFGIIDKKFRSRAIRSQKIQSIKWFFVQRKNIIGQNCTGAATPVPFPIKSNIQRQISFITFTLRSLWRNLLKAFFNGIMTFKWTNCPILKVNCYNKIRSFRQR